MRLERLVSIPLFSGLVTDHKQALTEGGNMMSQSLCFQGWLLTDRAMKSAQFEVSIPLFSGLVTDPFSGKE